ncbi:MAG: hypothetical protein GY820_33145 [Gammaproteobacteria bacterium]|nr:hypothetical protein [Gammaproteobacteria bacterium]
MALHLYAHEHHYYYSSPTVPYCVNEDDCGQEDDGLPDEGGGAVVPSTKTENGNKHELLLKQMEQRSMRCLSSVRSLLSGGWMSEGSQEDADIQEIGRNFLKVELGLDRLKGAGVDLPSSEAKSATMTKQRDQDPIELNRRKKRGERRRADAMAAAEYVDLLNEQLTCQSCFDQGAPSFSQNIWQPHTDEYDTEEEDQWRWIKCTRCPDGQNLFHTSCVDPSLYQANSECFILCQYCIGNSFRTKDGSVSANLLPLIYYASHSWTSQHREVVSKALFFTFYLMFFVRRKTFHVRTSRLYVQFINRN